MDILSILAGVAAIPKLLNRIDELLIQQDKMAKQKWMQISARVERKLHEASTPEDIRAVAVEIKHLIDES